MKLQGQIVTLRFAEESDRRRIYEWLAHSDLTPAMMGPPAFPSQPVPTWEEFCSDYKSHYFDDSAPLSGRSFIIEAEQDDVGVVSYNCVDLEKRETELDIWLRSEGDCGKGYGSDALKILCAYLHRQHGVEYFMIKPSKRNQRAIGAYKKAGFQLSPLPVEEQAARYGPGEYEDTIVLVKRIPF